MSVDFYTNDSLFDLFKTFSIGYSLEHVSYTSVLDSRDEDT